MGTSTTLPANWRMARSTSSPTWSAALTTLTQQASSGSPTTGGVYNWGSTSSERCPGAMTSGSFGSPNSLIGNYQNGNVANITKLTISYKGERFRVNSAAASVQFYYSLNGTSWTAVSAGNIATTSFPTGSNTYSFTSPTSVTVPAFSITGLSIAQSASFYLRWNINTTGSNSQGIGIDDISVTAEFAASCDAPSSIAFSNVTSSSADISWGSVSGAVDYQYELSNSITPPASGNSSAAATSITPTSLTAATKYYVHVRTECSGSLFSSWTTDSFTTSSGVSADISISSGLLDFGYVINGDTSEEFTYSVSGTHLGGDISITAPAGFYLSLSSGSNYTSSLSITPTGGTVNTTPVYVIYIPSSASGAVQVDLNNTSVGATTRAVSLVATSLATEPATNSVITFGTATTSSMVVNFNGGNGASRIVVAREGNAVTYTPSDGEDISGVSNVFTSASDQSGGNRVVYDGAAQTVTVSGLTTGTTYHFAVYEYNEGTGASRNYKTTSPATASNATLDNAIYLTGAFAETYTEDFNSIGSSSTASLPAGFQVSSATTAPVYGSSVTTATTQAYGSSGSGVVNSSSAGGFVNWASGVTASSTDRALGLLSTGSYASPRSLLAKVKNTTGNTITSLILEYHLEKIRSGTRAMNVNSYYSLNGSTWVLLETTSYAADASNTVISNPPATTTVEAMVNDLSVANDASFYLRWEFQGVGGSTNSQGIGVDDISITPFSVTRNASASDLTNGSYDNLNVVDSAELSGDITLTGRLHFAPGSKLALNDSRLTINGTITGSVNIEGSAQSSIVINGTGSLSELGFDQSEPGSTNRLKTFEMNRSGETVIFGNTLEITEAVLPTNGTIESNDNLALISDASGTARVGEINATADVSGNVTVQRYVPAVARRSRTLSSPVSNFTFSQYIDDMYLSGQGGASNGFDASPSNGNSIFTYQESTAGTGRGWKAISNINNALDAGNGALVFVRGDRTLDSTKWYASPYPAQNEVTIDYASQPINKGTISPVLSYTNTGAVADDGWNLVGNPYPSPIDWNLLDRQNLGAFYYTFDPVTGSYVADDGSAYIASGQAFFVQAVDAAPVITFTESAKSAATPVSYFKTGKSSLAFRMVRDSLNADVAWLRPDPLASRGYNPGEDALKFTNAVVNISFVLDSNVAVQVNTTPLHAVVDSFFLFVDAPAGTYTLACENVNTISTTKKIYLKDQLTGAFIDLRNQASFTFSITSNAASKGERFLLVIGDIPGVLPVKLLDFSGESDGEKNTLTWDVVNEKNIRHYIIQRSADAGVFSDVGQIVAINRQDAHRYVFAESLANEEKTYYRLCIVEQDGQRSYSKVIVISGKDLENSRLELYPNPADASGQVKLSYSLMQGSATSVTIISTLGEKLWKHADYKESGAYEQVLPKLDPGLYFLTIQLGQSQQVVRLVIQ